MLQNPDLEMAGKCLSHIKQPTVLILKVSIKIRGTRLVCDPADIVGCGSHNSG